MDCAKSQEHGNALVAVLLPRPFTVCTGIEMDRYDPATWPDLLDK
jgi:hypothetical protein